MKFLKEKKESIIAYILEKVAQGCTPLSKTVSENLGVNQNTVHRYINELVEQGVLVRVRRGEYRLTHRETTVRLSRAAGELNSDIAVYERCLEPHIRAFPENVRAIWSYAFTEMINNVMDHSEAEAAEVTILQDPLKTTVTIYDNGIGIFQKIKRHFGLPSTEDAIKELFKGKLTTDRENHSGEGIFFSSKLMDDFYIFSDGKLFAKNRFERTGIRSLEPENAPGTLVLMSLANKSGKTAREIFDQYASPDGGFWKTKLALKNFFPAAPVSRSQAKRLCNRLEQFKIVELDFNGVAWMGQGFAHQLFVVFARAFPQVQLIPLNMSEPVESMYRHVLNTEAPPG